MLISAVVPTYNRGHLIERALRSILDQTRAVDEVIVVDDGSSDDTAAVVSRLDGVRYHLQANAGASVARNTGVSLASGRYVAFLDSDDYWLADHVEQLAAAAEATGHAAALYFADCYFSAPGANDPDSTLWQLAGFQPGSPYELTDTPTRWALMSLQPTMLQSAMIDRAAYHAAGGLDPALRLRHDTSLFLALALGHSWCAVANIGTRMTPEADNRLTGAVPDASPSYWHETVSMYITALQQYAGRPRMEQAELRARLSVAHWRLARLAMGRREPLTIGRHLARAVQTDWRTVARTLTRRAGQVRVGSPDESRASSALAAKPGQK